MFLIGDCDSSGVALSSLIGDCDSNDVALRSLIGDWNSSGVMQARMTMKKKRRM